MQLESRTLLTDALTAVDLIEQFTRGRKLEDLAANPLLRSGIYWQFAVLGEALSRLQKVDTATFELISESWRIVGFRNQILHGYDVIRDQISWQIIEDKLPLLKVELEHLLKT